MFIVYPGDTLKCAVHNQECVIEVRLLIIQYIYFHHISSYTCQTLISLSISQLFGDSRSCGLLCCYLINHFIVIFFIILFLGSFGLAKCNLNYTVKLCTNSTKCSILACPHCRAETFSKVPRFRFFYCKLMPYTLSYYSVKQK